MSLLSQTQTSSTQSLRSAQIRETSIRSPRYTMMLPAPIKAGKTEQLSLECPLTLSTTHKHLNPSMPPQHMGTPSIPSPAITLMNSHKFPQWCRDTTERPNTPLKTIVSDLHTLKKVQDRRMFSLQMEATSKMAEVSWMKEECARLRPK